MQTGSTTLAILTGGNTSSAAKVTIAGSTAAELIDSDGEQSYFLVNAFIDQSGTAAYNGVKVNVVEDGTGDGSTGDGNNLANFAVSGVSLNRIDNKGRTNVAGDDPALSSCGTTPSIVGSDAAGKVTIGTGSTTSCTVTFATAFDNAPACVITGDNIALGYAATTSTTVLTVTSSADMASDVISYLCIGL